MIKGALLGLLLMPCISQAMQIEALKDQSPVKKQESDLAITYCKQPSSTELDWAQLRKGNASYHPSYHAMMVRDGTVLPVTNPQDLYKQLAAAFIEQQKKMQQDLRS
jgi:hypothetical protein